MSLEDTIGYQNEGEACVVCGKGLRRDEALAHMHHEGQRFPICCPLCLEAWEKDPKPYIQRLAKRALLRELRKSGAMPPPTSPLSE
jgi:hypothetical protein